MYEQGLPTDQYGLPSGQYCSLGIHESQSRLWENFVGRSESFWQHFFPAAKARFPDALEGVGSDQFYAAVNEVAPSLIRVEADEATYNLHIIVRFELERELIDGQLNVSDLPAAWSEKYQKALEISPPDDAMGVLQDVHWSAGLIGYFPTYSLGNLYAAQLFASAEEQIGPLDTQFSAGDFSTLKGWLHQNVHQFGKCRTPHELCVGATKNELSHRHLITHLRNRLAKIYGLAG
jgi:carboxypeptidase Taq